MKNIHVFAAQLPSIDEIETAVGCYESPFFRECEENDFSTFGLKPDSYITKLANGYRLDFICEEKILPPAAIRREVLKHIRNFEEMNGEPPGKKQVLELKELVISKLVKKALTKAVFFSAFYHEATELLIVDVSREDLASRALSLLTHILQSIETKTLHVSDVSNGLSQNLQYCIKEHQELAFSGFAYGDKLHLCNTDKETARFTGDYTLEHVSDLLGSGFLVKRVRLERDDVSFDLTDEFKIKGIKSSIKIEDEDLDKPSLVLAEQAAILEVMAANCVELKNFFQKDVA